MKPKPIGTCDNTDCRKPAHTLIWRDPNKPQLGAICEECRERARKMVVRLAVLAKQQQQEAA